MVSRHVLLTVCVTLFTGLLPACASFPGKTRQEQIQNVGQFTDKTLADLYARHPAAREQIQKSVGYTLMTNKTTKIPVFGVGAGHGMGHHTRTGERTYLRMRRFDFGAGWGARSLRSILIFHDEEAYRKFVDGSLEVKLGAEAAAKVGDAGAAGGGDAPKPLQKDPGFVSYLLTDAGVSATATLGVIRVKPVSLKKK